MKAKTLNVFLLSEMRYSVQSQSFFAFTELLHLDCRIRDTNIS
jgi:hypothetical protein